MSCKILSLIQWVLKPLWKIPRLPLQLHPQQQSFRIIMVYIFTSLFSERTFCIEKDYSNYVLAIHQNSTGITISPFPTSHFTIIFWFYLHNGTNAMLISLLEEKKNKQFEIAIRQNR